MQTVILIIMTMLLLNPLFLLESYNDTETYKAYEISTKHVVQMKEKYGPTSPEFNETMQEYISYFGEKFPLLKLELNDYKY